MARPIILAKKCSTISETVKLIEKKLGEDGATMSSVAGELGLSPQQVKIFYGLADLCAIGLRGLDNNKITMKDAVRIAAMPVKEQKLVLDELLSKGDEKTPASLKTEKTKKEKPPKSSADSPFKGKNVGKNLAPKFGPEPIQIKCDGGSTVVYVAYGAVQGGTLIINCGGGNKKEQATDNGGNKKVHSEHSDDHPPSGGERQEGDATQQDEVGKKEPPHDQSGKDGGGPPAKRQAKKATRPKPKNDGDSDHGNGIAAALVEAMDGRLDSKAGSCEALVEAIMAFDGMEEGDIAKKLEEIEAADAERIGDKLGQCLQGIDEGVVRIALLIQQTALTL